MNDEEQRRQFCVEVAERHLDRMKAALNQKKFELYRAEADLTQAYVELEAARKAMTSAERYD